MATILIAEDDAMVMATIAFILAEQGHDVIQATNGAEAVKIFKNPAPDRTIALVITDIIMPKGDGMSLIAELRQLDGKLKILAISGLGRAGYSSFLGAAKNLGAHDSLKKPFTRQQLLEKVELLLGVVAAPDGVAATG
jgi:DNA-binding response OmpR family regulator